MSKISFFCQSLALLLAITVLPAAAQPGISINDVSVTEGNSGTVVARFTFRLSAPASETVTVRFGTANGTATAGSDYVSRTGTTTFAPGETSKTQPFTVNGDTVSEGDETFFVNLSSSVGATIAKAQGIATIVNDDGAAPPPDTTPDAFSFTPVTGVAPGSVQTSNSITVSGINAASPISVTGGSYSINGGAFVTAAGTVTVGQTVRVQQTAASAASTTTTATLSIGGVSSGYAVTTAAPVQPSVSITDASASEGNSGTSVVRLTLRLSAPSSQTVTVRFATANGTATAGSDYVARTGTTTFAPGETSKTQPFTINGDTAVENDETVLVNLNTPVGLTIAKGQGVITIVNDDAPPPDTTPEPFAFAAVVDAPLGSVQTSNSITVSGINAPSPVTITGGLYSVDGGSFTDRPGSVVNGARVSAQVLAAYGFSETRTATLNIGGVSATFEATTRAADTRPDAFAFPARVDVERNSLIDSEPVRITGIDAPATVAVANGFYSIDGGQFGDAPSTVAPNSSVVLRVMSSSAHAEMSVATLTVGGVSAAFAVTTRAADTTPDPFVLFPLQAVEPESTVDSDLIRITGIDAPTPIAIVGGAYSIDGGPFIEADGVIAPGAQIVVRTTAAKSPASTTKAVLSVGGITADFVVTTRAADIEPDAFAFAPANRTALGVLVRSGLIVVTGTDAPAPIEIVGGFYSVNGRPFTDAPSTVPPRATVEIEVLSAFGYAETRSAVITIGGVSASFDVTTRAVDDDATPDSLIFEPIVEAEPAMRIVSAPVTVTGINFDVPISIIGGRYQVNGGPFTDSAGTVAEGDTVSIELYSAAEPGGSRMATLTVGELDAVFVVTTGSESAVTMDSPNALAFAPAVDVEPGAVSTSDLVLIDGINVPVPISVTGGQYRINGSAPMTMVGEVRQGDLVSVEVVAPTEFNATASATLMVGRASAVYSVTTRGPDLVPDLVVFAPAIDVAPGATVTSEAVVLSGFESAVPISIVGGAFRLNGGVFATGSASARAGDQVEIQIAASPGFAATTTATLTVGAVQADFSVSTRFADITPDPFSFNEQTQAFPGLAAVSEPVTVSGIDVPVTVSVSGGRYSINGGPYIDLDGPVSKGDTVRVLVLAGPNRGDARAATLTVGGVSTAFRVVTDAPIDTLPDFLRFPDVTVPRSTVVDSAPIVVRGINSATPISITGGSFSVNGGAFGNAAAFVRGGDTVVLRGQGSASFNSTIKVVVTVGGELSEWSVRTEQQPDRLQAFTLTNASIFRGGAVVPGSTQLSDPITVLDLATPSAISVSGGSYSINDGPFTTESGQVVRGDKVVVRTIASASFATTSSTTLTIGSRSSTMTVTTTKDPVASTPASYTDCTSHIYRALAPVPMRLFVCRPSGWKQTDRRSALVQWFGGGFVSGTTDNSIADARYWSKTHGMVGIAPDYRVNERFGGYATQTIDDARAALRWIASHADELGIDVSRIAVSGSSAGGGAAAFASLSETPTTARPEDDPGVRPAAMISRAGVIDTTTDPQNVQYLSSFRFGSLANALSPRRNLDAKFPPTIIFHGDQDNVVGPVPSVNFCTALIEMGKVCEFRSLAGLSHDLGPKSAQIRDETAGFLRRFGLLPAVHN